jgi:hypothetical protein
MRAAKFSAERAMSNVTVIGSHEGIITISAGLGVLGFVFLSALGIVWSLKRIGGKMTGDVSGKYKKYGASLLVTGTGLLGCYLAVVTAEFACFYLTIEFMKSFSH